MFDILIFICNIQSICVVRHRGRLWAVFNSCFKMGIFPWLLVHYSAPAEHTKQMGLNLPFASFRIDKLSSDQMQCGPVCNAQSSGEEMSSKTSFRCPSLFQNFTSPWWSYRVVTKCRPTQGRFFSFVFPFLSFLSFPFLWLSFSFYFFRLILISFGCKTMWHSCFAQSIFPFFWWGHFGIPLVPLWDQL